MQSYKNLILSILEHGKDRPNRTGTGARSQFGVAFEHYMDRGLPVLTTKKVNTKACIHELLWFLKGDTNIKYLNDNGVHIWDPWADANGDLGPVYGKQWIESGPNKINQIDFVINEIKTNPHSRRILLDTWNPSDMQDMALPPCHVLYQFYVDPATMQLSLQVYMRSADVFLGLPFDIAEGGILLSLIAKVTGYTPYKLRYVIGDAHIYENHILQVCKLLQRTPLTLPTLILPEKESIYDYKYEDFEIKNYKHHGFLKGDVAV